MHPASQSSESCRSKMTHTNDLFRNIISHKLRPIPVLFVQTFFFYECVLPTDRYCLIIIDPHTNSEPKCCNVPIEQRHQACWPIDIPSNDPFYSLFRRTCLDFVRSGTGVREQCKLGKNFSPLLAFRVLRNNRWICWHSMQVPVSLSIPCRPTWTLVSSTESTWR